MCILCFEGFCNWQLKNEKFINLKDAGFTVNCPASSESSLYYVMVYAGNILKLHMSCLLYVFQSNWCHECSFNNMMLCM